MVKLLTIIVIIALLLTSCSALRSKSEKARESYCAETNPIVKKLFLGIVKHYIPGYPDKGMCVDPLGMTTSDGKMGK